MAAHLPAMLQAAGATTALAIAAAALIGPSQVAARLLEYALVRRIHPITTARLAAPPHTASMARERPALRTGARHMQKPSPRLRQASFE
jgi:hypothetical protein